ncbi:MAG: Long-chain-fatty-acid--CoA ligase, partial [Planctomycetota bacterium]
MPKTPFHAVGLIRRSSISYVRHVLTLNERRQPVVSLADAASTDQVNGIVVASCIDPEVGGGWFDEQHALVRDDSPAQVSFTSGTEGKPKAVVLSHANLSDASERLIAEMELTSEVREYIGVPVTHSFGMARARVVSAVGGRSYLPQRGFDPKELARMLAAGEVNSLAAVPTLLRLLLQKPEVIGKAGENLRWMEIGSQYMSGAEKLAIRKLFPKARIVQHYGLTEASRSTFLKVSEAPEAQLEAVGRPVGKTEIDITPEGLIRIRGPHVAKWRIEDGRFVPLTGPDGWFVTNDRGHLQDGTLYFDGRADDLINSGGCKVNPDQLETQIGKVLGQSGKVVVAKVPDPVRGEGILVVTDEKSLDVPRVRAAAVEALKSMGLEVGDAMHVRAVASIPLTATGKPMRRAIAEQFLAQIAAEPKPRGESPIAGRPADVLAYFRQFFPGREIDTDASFEALGGDSLGYIQFSMGFEDRFGPLPSGWESQTVAQLQAQLSTTGKKGWLRLESATLTRAFFMICIVALHLATFEYSKNWGAAYFLYMLAGYSLMRFQWPEISRTGSVATLLGTVVRIAIPTVLAVVFMQ